MAYNGRFGERSIAEIQEIMWLMPSWKLQKKHRTLQLTQLRSIGYETFFFLNGKDLLKYNKAVE